MVKEKQRKRRYMTTKNLFDKKDVAPVQLASDKLTALIGDLEPYGSWLIFGHEKQGKTSLALQLAKALSFYQKVLYVSAEEGDSPSFRAAVKRAGIVEGDKILWEHEAIPFAQLTADLKLRNAPRIVIIDNLTVYQGEFTIAGYNRLAKELPQHLVIFMAHKKGNIPTPSVAVHIAKLSKLKINIEGMLAHFNSRMAPAGQYVISEHAEQYYGSEVLEQ